MSKIFGFYISNDWVTCGLHANKVKELVVLSFSRWGTYSRLQFSVAYIVGDLTKKKKKMHQTLKKNACFRKHKRLDFSENAMYLRFSFFVLT